MDENEFISLKLFLLSIKNDISDDNLEVAKESIIHRLLQIDCKSLRESIQDVRQAPNSERLKEKVGSIVALCDLIVKTRYTLC